MVIKYRVHELAKDFNIDNNEIIEVLSRKFGSNKKYMAALTERELNYVFEYYITKNEKSDFNEYFDLKNKKIDIDNEKSIVDKNIKSDRFTKQTELITANKSRIDKPSIQKGQEKEDDSKDNTIKITMKDSGDSSARYEKEVTHIDTKAVAVNLDKYNEKYERIAPTNSFNNSKFTQRKQKFQNKNNKGGYQGIKKGETEAQKLQRLALERARKQQLKVLIPEEISVSDLAIRLKVSSTQVIKILMPLGIMASQSEVIDFDTASLVAEELGARVEKEIVVTIEERLFDETEDVEENLVTRSPIVVVMGHVDHGKTSLLDKIRNSDVTSGEAGGITQHIGAYKVAINGRDIAFLDTPGHEAFTSMRARGASVTDVAILVVAADDGIMPQTIEAINHAKEANVAIIVAMNKVDKPGANIEKIKQELTEHELVPEEWGGDIICCPVSAKTGEGIENLLEMVLLASDLRDLKCNPNRLAKGTVIEAKLNVGKGPIATILVQNGTLRVGDAIIAGTSVGRVRLMVDDKGRSVKEAGASTPVEITGLGEVPSAGDLFNCVEDEKLARELADRRKHKEKEEKFKSVTKVTLDSLFTHIEEGKIKELGIIVKADVHGSIEAIKESLLKLSNEEVRVRIIHGGVGAISKSDVMLANASGAIIIGFNVRPQPIAQDEADKDGVELRLYRVIYDAIDDVRQAMKGMLDPKTREINFGRVEVRQVYKITNVGTIAGCYVIEGKVVRSALIRVVRDGIVIFEDKIDSLKRFKDDAKEVAQGYECGVGLVKFNDIKEGDILESFTIEEYRD
ncbi:MAG: translation initiation factor IF-2 [Oscillospiraceae bacterium]|nr:translation initiation factor IF-2 [Oscillospiraceae bacterium]